MSQARVIVLIVIATLWVAFLIFLIASFAEMHRPVLVGPSRKSFVAHVVGPELEARVDGTAGAVAWLVANGANIVRVHDVKTTVRVVRMVEAIKGAQPDSA